MIVFIIILIGIGYGISYANARPVFPKGTTLNGIDCSDLNAYDSREKLIKEWKKNSFEVRQNGSVIAILPLSNVVYDIDTEINEQLKPNFFTYVLRKLHFKDKKIIIKMNIKATGKKFDDIFNDINEFNDKGSVIKTRDAHINFNSPSFEIVKEVNGNNIDKLSIKQDILKKISNGKFVLDFEKENFYEKPKVVSTNPILADEQEFLINLDIMNITYKMPKGDIDVKTSDVLMMYGITNENIVNKMKKVNRNNLSSNRKNVEKFVERLVAKYDTRGKSRKFKTHRGSNISIKTGDYGYLIDKKSETKKLINDLNNKRNVERKPCYYQVPYDKSDKIGNSYVEIDLSSQHLWVYKKGKVMLSTDIVTGNVAGGYATPSGVYYLKYKQRDTTLEGDNSDGSKYASPVSYWMPFNGGIGMHDASWRKSFGGSIYRYGGSHGCVNMPPASAAATFGIISEGYPVVVHY